MNVFFLAALFLAIASNPCHAFGLSPPLLAVAKPRSLRPPTPSVIRALRRSDGLFALSASADASLSSSASTIPSPSSQTKSNLAKGIACVLGGAMVHLTIGTIYCWGNFISYAPERLLFFDGMQHPGVPPDALYAIPINFAVQSLVMPFSPKFVRMLGASRALLIGSWIVAASIYLASFQTTLASFLSFYSVLFGIGIGLSYTIPMGAGWKWLPDRKGLVSGGVLTGLGAGGFLFSLIGSKIVNPRGLNMVHGRFPSEVYGAFPGMLRTLAVIFAGLSFVGSMLVSEPPPSQSPSASNNSPTITTSSPDTAGLTVRQALGSSQFWRMWWMIVCSATAGLNTVAVYKQFAALSPALSKDSYLALVGGVAALFNGSGRLLWGYLSDRIGFKTSFKLVTLLQAVLLTTYPLTVRSPLAFAVNTCMMIFCLAGTLALMPPATQRMFGPLAGTVIYGILYSAFAFASIVGGVLTKALVQSRGWSTVFRTMTAMSLAATALVSQLSPVTTFPQSSV